MKTVGPRIEGATGAVLRGGASRRMGCDKAGIRFAGSTLLERTVRTLAGVFDEVLVVGSGSAGRGSAGRASAGPGGLGFDAPAHVRAVPDERPGLGPVGGIVTALAAATRPWVFVCACDMPFLDAHAILALAGRVAGTSGLAAVAPRAGGNAHPLAAFYSRGALEAARAAAEAGRLSARGLLEEIRAAYIDVDPGSTLVRALTNVNTPEDLARAEREFGDL